MRIKLNISSAEITRMLRKAQLYQRRKHSEIEKLIEDTANSVAVDAKSRVSVRSGITRDSIKVLLQDLAREMTAYVVADEFWARFLEVGTSKARAHPFMLPAAEAHLPRFLIRLRQILSRR